MATTNSQPGVIVKYFLEAVDTVGGMYMHYKCATSMYVWSFVLCVGCPSVVRCDPGTENYLLAKAQVALRLCHGDGLAGERSFIYGPSSVNVVSNT